MNEDASTAKGSKKSAAVVINPWLGVGLVAGLLGSSVLSGILILNLSHFEDARRQAGELDAQIIRTRREVSSLQVQVDSLTKQRDALEPSVADLEKRKDTAEAALATSEGKQRQIESQIAQAS